MPIVKTIKGNLLKMFKDDQFEMIVHGCNCFHTMGAGIAGQINRMFPEAFKADKQSRYGDAQKMGQYTFAWTPFGMIVNGYTQFQPGRESKLRLNRAVGEVFCRLSLEAQVHYPGKELIEVGIPQIGAGIAGGDWPVLESIIDGVSDGLSIVVVEYDGS